jgi:flavin reductase (DIM6/NTAB) family NADH-FMN oxidoreductase RutF
MTQDLWDGESAAPHSAPLDSEALREARREHAAAVTAVTYADESGFHGVTVTAFTFVSIQPPMILICLGRSSAALEAIKRRGSFAVNLLGDRQAFLADQLAGRAPLVSLRFAGVPHQMTRLGNPALTDSLVWLDCVVDRSIPAGDHEIVLTTVVEVRRGNGDLPLLYFDSRYREIQSG